MPELPEVETVKRILTPLLVNKTIANVEVLYPKMILSPVEEFKKSLQNQTFLSIKRKGKYLLFYLTNDLVLISHLRMEGKYILLGNNESKTSHARVIFNLTNNESIAYDDTRCFGIMKLVKEKDLNNEEMLNKLGQEPFDIHDITYIKKRLQKSNNPIKVSIMDQSIISGLGNIYADEVLFRSKINPLTPSSKVNDEDIRNIVSNSVIVLNKAIELGGSTVRSYHAARGVDGKFQNELLVYGKKDECCPSCHYVFKKIYVGGRGTTFCPHCQKYKFNTCVVGIVGQIASGKSLALNYFKNKGYETISSDEIVHTLYQDINVIKKLKIHFARAIKDDIIDRKILKDIIINDAKKKKQLEEIIHPLVEETIFNFIKNAKGKIVFIEVPLLFDAHMDYLCDYIIGIDASKEDQIEHLKMRGVKDIDSYLTLNKDNAFEVNRNKINFLTNKNISKDELFKELDIFLNNIKSHL